MQDYASALADALAGDRPIAHVGATDAIYAAALELGFRLARVDAARLEDLDAQVSWDPASRAPWLIVIDGCEHAVRTGDLPEDAPRQGEDLLLDLAFDGHPSLPANRTVVLAFGEPTDLSDALACDECPCSFVGLDHGTATDEEPLRLAA